MNHVRGSEFYRYNWRMFILKFHFKWKYNRYIRQLNELLTLRRLVRIRAAHFPKHTLQNCRSFADFPPLFLLNSNVYPFIENELNYSFVALLLSFNFYHSSCKEFTVTIKYLFFYWRISSPCKQMNNFRLLPLICHFHGISWKAIAITLFEFNSSQFTEQSFQWAHQLFGISVFLSKTAKGFSN